MRFMTSAIFSRLQVHHKVWQLYLNYSTRATSLFEPKSTEPHVFVQTRHFYRCLSVEFIIAVSFEYEFVLELWQWIIVKSFCNNLNNTLRLTWHDLYLPNKKYFECKCCSYHDNLYNFEFTCLIINYVEKNKNSYKKEINEHKI